MDDMIDAQQTLEGTDDEPLEVAEDASSAAQGDAPIEIQPQRVVEAVLMASDSPLSAAKIAAILEVGTARDVRKHVAALNEQYASDGMSFRIEQIAGGYQILTLPAYNRWLTKLLHARQETKLSPAAMETLAIVAYRQPCTRAEIEAIRGVAVGERLQRLREMNLVKIVGRAEDLGRPMLYGTTKRFLQTFGLASLEDLPQVEALKRPASERASEESTSSQETESREEASPAEAGGEEGVPQEEAAVVPESEQTSEPGDELSEGADSGEIVSHPVGEDSSPNLSIVREADAEQASSDD